MDVAPDSPRDALRDRRPPSTRGHLLRRARAHDRFTPVLRRELYGPLRDESFFNRVELDREAHTLVWPNGADLDPATLHVRIWPVGTERLLGVEQAPDESINVPPGLMPWVRLGTVVFADIEVCPLTEERAGHLRLVCVEGARNIRVERHSGDDRQPERIELPSIVRP